MLAEIGATYKASARQVALAFLTRKPTLFAIPKAAKAEHVTDNAGAGRFKLSEAEVDRVDQAFPEGPRRRGLPML